MYANEKTIARKALIYIVVYLIVSQDFEKLQHQRYTTWKSCDYENIEADVIFILATFFFTIANHQSFFC